jgi:RNA polymerase sigma-70 factor (ECF subfamily)
MTNQDPSEYGTELSPHPRSVRPSGTPTSSLMTARDNADWQRSLAQPGRKQTAALSDLRALVFQGLRAYLQRHVVARRLMRAEDANQLAQDCTQDTLLQVLNKLDSFRGESRFTTWVYTIAVRNVLGELRRRRWQDVSIDNATLGVVPELATAATSADDPEQSAQRQQAWAIIQDLIHTTLTERQRFALVAHAFQEMPLDLLAKRLRTNRDNVYKLIHDARRKLKLGLTARGYSQPEMASLFGLPGKKARSKRI